MGQVRRRQFLIAVGALVGAPLAASKVAAQTPQKVYRVAHLSTAGRTPDRAPPRALRMSFQRGLPMLKAEMLFTKRDLPREG